MTTPAKLADAGRTRGVGELAIAGLVPLSTCDWPGKLAATLFLQGCPWECTYCHNPALIDPRAEGTVAFSEVEALLVRRGGLLDGVVFSGGEPTRQAQLLPAIERVRQLGFEVGLHTGGAYPRRLARVVADLDWVGFDVKAGRMDYERLTGRASAATRAFESLEVLLSSGVDHEVRTTVDPGVHTPDGLRELHEELRGMGVRRHVLQLARSTGTSEPFALSLARQAPRDVVPDDLWHLVRQND